MSYYGLMIDVVIAAALAIAIFQAWRLRVQIERMQADRRDFENLIKAMNVASERAESAVKSLKETASVAGDTLQEQINTARGLADELEIMIHAGDNLADRLGQAAAQNADVPPEKEDAPRRTKAEQDLQEAIKTRQKR
ncbi:MAG: DUF6468 domain-containing protein [Alphaproteobacteria bacterium]|nr:DUF6468 domain-containing protein [Alphaproteobacteria bacterium]